MSGKMLQFVNQAKAMPKKRAVQDRIVDFDEIYADFDFASAEDKPADVRNVACPSVR